MSATTVEISSEGEKQAIQAAMSRLSDRLRQLVQDVQGMVGTFSAPPAYGDVARKFQSYKRIRETHSGNPWPISGELAPVLVRALRDWRAERAANLEAQSSKVTDKSVLGELQKELAVLDDLVRQPWVKTTAPARLPRLADIVTLQLAEADLRERWAAQPRQYDEKFHILQAPALRWHDLNYFREACALRDRALGLAFVDIDEFGAINKALTEPVVDELVLPPFMRTLEAAAFGRGFAYRMGGDEYLLLFPNVETVELRALLVALRETIEQLSFAGVNSSTTVSIGYVLLVSRKAGAP